MVDQSCGGQQPPWAKNPTKFSNRVLWTRQKVKDEAGPDSFKTCVGIQRAQISLFKRKAGS
jgi:hypothetical protein